MPRWLSISAECTKYWIGWRLMVRVLYRTFALEVHTWAADTCERCGRHMADDEKAACECSCHNGE